MRTATRFLFAAALTAAAFGAVVIFEPQSLLDDDPTPAAAARDSAAAAIQTLATEFNADGSFVYSENSTAYASLSGPEAPSIVISTSNVYSWSPCLRTLPLVENPTPSNSNDASLAIVKPRRFRSAGK